VGLIDEVGAGPVAVDTAAFIYFIEAHRFTFRRCVRSSPPQMQNSLRS